MELLLDCRLARKDYLQINAFSDLVVMEEEESPHALLKKATGGAISEVVTKTAVWTRPSLTLKTLTSAFTRLFLYDGGPSSLCGRDSRR